jgi:hypothetical protein
MALNDASPQAGSSSNGNAPANASTGAPITPNPVFAKYFPVKIKPELAVKPDPFTLYFGFFGVRNWRRNLAEHLLNRVEAQWLATNRQPTQDEMDVYTAAGSRGLYYKTFGLPASAFISTGLVLRGLTKEPDWPSHAKTPAEFVTLLKLSAEANGSTFAQAMFRPGFKIFFWTMTGWLVSSLVGSWSEAASIIKDPRMRHLTEELRTLNPEETRRRRMYASVDRLRRERRGEETISAQMQRDLNSGSGYDQDQYSSDNSASYGAQSAGDMAYSTSQDSQQINSTGQTPSAPDTSRPQVYDTPRGMTDEPPAYYGDTAADFLLGDIYDDASPTAQEYRNTNPDGSPAGSAWDRVRRRNGLGSQQPSARPIRMQQRSQPQNASEAEYAPANDQDRYNMEKRHDKEQAHAEFNKMVEAEKHAYSDTSSQNRG